MFAAVFLLSVCFVFLLPVYNTAGRITETMVPFGNSSSTDIGVCEISCRNVPGCCFRRYAVCCAQWCCLTGCLCSPDGCDCSKLTMSQKISSFPAQLIAVGGTQTNDQFRGTNDVDIILISKDDNHTPADPVPTAGLEAFGGVVMNNILYVVGGGLTSREYSSRFMAYDVAANQWSNLPDFPFAVYANNVAAANNEIYSFGGNTTSHGFMDYTYKFDMAKNIWWRLSTPLPTDSVWWSCVAVDNRYNQIYLIVKKGEMYRSDDGAQTWVQLDSIPTEQVTPSCALLESANAIVIAGGARANYSLNDVYIYDIGTNKWTASTPLTKRRMLAQAVVNPHTNDVIVCGGNDCATDETYSDCEIFSWKSKQWGFTNFVMNKPRMTYGLYVTQVDSKY